MFLKNINLENHDIIKYLVKKIVIV